MFATELAAPSRLPSILRYFSQLIVSYPLAMLAGLPLSAALSVLGLGEHGQDIYFAGYRAMVCLVAGSFIGWIIGRRVPHLVPTGRWIWALPGFVVFLAIVGDFLVSMSIPWLPETFFATSSNEGLGVYLLTLPAFSALGYSVGMALVGKRLSGVAVLASALLFSILVVFAHEFERSRIEAWSRTKFVMDTQGLRFSRDPYILCSSGEAQLLRSGTAVEAMEYRDCGPGRLLEKDEQRRPGMWSVVRVKILDGPSRGAQGWVLAYGIEGYRTIGP